MSVLLAVGQRHLAEILRQNLGEADFEVSDTDVLHRNYLNELIEQERPSILIVHDHYLPNDSESPQEADAELLRMVEQWRVKYDDGMRIVFLCERERKDPFLANLVARNVLDIFNERVLPTKVFLEQLSEPARYSNVAKFGIGGGLELVFDQEAESVDEAEEDVELPSKEEIPKVSRGDKALELSKHLIDKLAERKKVVTVTETVEIEKEHIRNIYQMIPSKVIVVGSLYPGAGATLLASNLARMMAVRDIDVAYIEHPHVKPYMFDRLQIHQVDEEYHDVARQVKEEGVLKTRKKEFVKDGVRWYVNDSRKPKLSSFSYENMLILSHAVHANIIVLDIGNLWNEPEVKKYLYLADHILLCIEPDPVKYDWALFSDGDHRQGEHDVMELLMKDEDLSGVELVMMKDFKSSEDKLLRSILHKPPLASLPYIPYPSIQKSLLDGKLLYDYEDYGTLFEESLKELLAAFVPKEVLNLRRGTRRKLAALFKR